MKQQPFSFRHQSECEKETILHKKAGLKFTMQDSHCKIVPNKRTSKTSLAALHRHERVSPPGGTVELPVKLPKLLNIHGPWQSTSAHSVSLRISNLFWHRYEPVYWVTILLAPPPHLISRHCLPSSAFSFLSLGSPLFLPPLPLSHRAPSGQERSSVVEPTRSFWLVLIACYDNDRLGLIWWKMVLAVDQCTFVEPHSRSRTFFFLFLFRKERE